MSNSGLMRGSGTKEDPYQIDSWQRFQSVNQDLYASYELVCNINAENTRNEWSRGFKPIGPFGGTFEGNDNQIRNVHINQPKIDDIGIFSENQGQIKNLSVVNSTITGNNYVGGVVGFNRGKLSSLCATGNVSGNKNVGGLVGSNEGKIVSSHAVENVSGSKFVGILVGHNEGHIISSYSKGDVSGDECVGILIGDNWNKVVSSYAVGDVSGGSSSSVLIGRNYDKELSNSSFFFSDYDGDDTLGKPDLVVSKDEWQVSYIVDSNTLCLRVNNENYSCSKVSPERVQKLVESLEYDDIEIKDNFRSFLVAIK